MPKYVTNMITLMTDEVSKPWSTQQQRKLKQNLPQRRKGLRVQCMRPNFKNRLLIDVKLKLIGRENIITTGSYDLSTV